MKESYISAEFLKIPTNGTFSMLEKRSFFGSKMMDIEDIFNIDQSSIVFKEEVNTHQQTTVGFGSEINNNNYNFDLLKGKYHSIIINPKQTEVLKKELTSWQLVLNADDLLSDYLFAKIKQARSFENVLNVNTSANSVDLAIREYIKLNLLRRIEIKNIDFYVQYFSLFENPALLKYSPKYDLNVKINAISNNFGAYKDNIQIDKNIIDNTYVIIYNQKRNALQYKFDYYFDVTFGKI